MSKNGLKKRSHIFDLYSSNLSLLVENNILRVNPELTYKPSYVCPLCLEVFPKDYINDKPEFDNYLTLEHVPPESYGGKIGVLTCHACNTKSGGQLDPQIEKAFTAKNALDPAYKLSHQTRVILDNELDLGVSLSPTDENNFHLEIYKKLTDPKHFNKLQVLFESKKEVNIQFTIKGADKVKYPKALLRIAHLLSFQKFGYQYLFSPGTWGILKILNEEDQNYHGDSINSHGLTDGFYIIPKPINLMSLVVVFTLDIESHKEKHAIILPNPFDSELSIYKNTAKIYWEKIQIASPFKIPNHNYLTSLKYIVGYIHLFKELIKRSK